MKSSAIAIAALIIGLAIGRFVLQPAPTAQDQADGTSSGQTEPVRWKMASAFASSLPIAGTHCLQFTERLVAATGGEIELKFFEPGALVPVLEIFDAVSSGAIDAGCSSPGFWAGKLPAMQIFAAIPFGPRPGEYLAWLYYGGGEELFREIYQRHNIYALHCQIIPPEGSGWFRHTITSVDDLNGLKMRFFGLGALVMEKFGVSTQLLAPGDIFPALELGTIDATEFSMPAIDLDLGFYQVAQHYYFPGWHQPASLGELLINIERWNTLSERQKAMIEMACGDNIRHSLAEGEATQFTALKTLQGHGVELHSWSPEMLAAFATAWDEVVADEAAKDADFARAWESLSTFRKDYALWEELGYIK